MANANAVIAGRQFLVYSAPHAASNDLPADNVTYGSDWGEPWVNRGYTHGGLQLSMGLERGEIRVDQEFDPVFRPITGRTITLSTELAEMTPENLRLASGLGTIQSVAPGAGTRGHDDLVITSDVSETFNSWGYDIRQPDGEAFRVIVYKGIATGSPQPQFTPDNPATIALEISALVDTSTNPARIAKVRDVLPAL
jgi:hypothetical protein